MVDGELTAVSDRRIRASGAIFMSVFGFVWAVGPPALEDRFQLPVLVASVAVTVVTLVLALRPKGGGTRHLVKDWQQRYNRVVLVEFAAIAVAVVVLILLGAPALIAPVACLIVGAHFFPMAQLFGQQVYRWTGVALVVVSSTGLVVAETAGGDPARTTVGLSAALCLWLTSAAVSRAVDRPRVPAGR